MSRLYVIVLVFNSFLVTVLSAHDIYEVVEAVVGHSAELPCKVSAEKEDDHLTILAWYRNGSSTAFYSRDFREGGDVGFQPGGVRYNLIKSEEDGLDKLQLLAVTASDAGVYQCLADFASSPAHKTFVQLVVIEPPHHLWVIHENGTQVAKASSGVNVSQNVGPYYIGDVVHLFCVAFGGKPQASLAWWSERRLLKDTWTPLSEHRVRSDLMYGPLQREDHGRVLSCFARNNDKTLPLSVDIIIDMFLPPELVSLRVEGSLEGGRVKAGEALSLQCRVLGARPPPPLLWRLDDAQLLNLQQNITMESSQRLVVSSAQLAVGREHDESRLSCCAPKNVRDDDGFVCSQGFALIVLYPPALQIIAEGEVTNDTLTLAKGASTRLACGFQANPAVRELVWYRDRPQLDEDLSDLVQTGPLLELESVTETEAGEYVCAGTNDEGTRYSDPLKIDVIFPPFCTNETVLVYGLGESESVNLTCAVTANPAPRAFRWALVAANTTADALRRFPHSTAETAGNTLLYQRPNGTTINTIFCWGVNDVSAPGQPCAFHVTDETAPHAPAACAAGKNEASDIVVKCESGHNGGLPQTFKLKVQALDSEDVFMTIETAEPQFVVQDLKAANFKFVVSAFNDKGESDKIEILKNEIVDASPVSDLPASAVTNITTLALALCGGVLLVALAACGLVLCAHEKGSQLDLPRDPPLCAYNTDESNCETYHGSEDGSECNVRRTESFRRAVARAPPPLTNFDVRRTSSFHSARYIQDVPEPDSPRCDGRHAAACRVRSMQNLHRRREMDTLCDHLVLHLPPETNYNVSKPMNTFYTMPRKMRHKAKELSDEVSEITQTSDGFSLPPPPDEFTSYRPGARIRDIPKATPAYTAVKKHPTKEPPKQYNEAMSTMNTVGVPTVSGGRGLYTYPDDDHQQDAQSSAGKLTFQTFFYPKESGL